MSFWGDSAAPEALEPAANLAAARLGDRLGAQEWHLVEYSPLRNHEQAAYSATGPAQQALVKVIADRPRTLELNEFLERPLFAHLATLAPEGPRESPVWFLWEKECLWIIGSDRTDSFPRRLQQDERCAVGIIDFDPRRGLVQHVGVRGRASIEPFDAGRAQRLLARYLGEQQARWDRRFQDTLSDPDNLLVRVRPETIVARDVSYELS